MAADKFDCPSCDTTSMVTATVVGRRETTRYRKCPSCRISFATSEAVKDTPRIRQIIGEAKSEIIWGKPGFKYRNPSVPRAGKKWDKSST